MSRKPTHPDLLNEAIAAWRRSEQAPEALRPESRGRIVEAAFADAASRIPAGFRPLFAPKRWVAALATVSMVLVAAVAILFQQERVGGATLVAADKVGSEVVFTIANGNRTHSVKKATHPALLERAEAVEVTDGRYSDAGHDSAAIVFYRID
jgi:hypothetical protein